MGLEGATRGERLRQPVIVLLALLCLLSITRAWSIADQTPGIVNPPPASTATSTTVAT